METCSVVGWYKRFGVINCFYLQEAGEGMVSLSRRRAEIYFLPIYNKERVVYQHQFRPYHSKLNIHRMQSADKQEFLNKATVLTC